jgi:hypothetical protein
MTTPFAPENAPEAGAEPQAPDTGGQPAEPQAPAGADPRVLEQMQNQLQQFGGVVGQMAEYLPAVQQIAQQQQQGEPEPSLDDLAAQFFGGDPYDPNDPGYGYDPNDPYAGQQAPPQQPQAPQGLQGDPNQLLDLMRRVVREEVTPLQQGYSAMQEQQEQQRWNALYDEFPALRDPEQAPQIAERVAEAAHLFARSPDEAKRFAQNAQFVRMVHLSSVNEQQARGETPAGSGDGPNPIESAGGASAPSAPEVDEGDAIVSAGRGNNGAGSYFGR